ncbi:MAG: helix-turn-helix domain-containing protein [Prevotella sp.]|nr:helix-turn-helix domain-containing protein [Prevotella sp.]
MLENLITSMPMYVCTFWSVLLLIDVARNRQTAKKRLLTYMVTAALLYAGHYIFFNHQTALMPFTDTIYVMSNLAVFPLYFMYIKEITEPAWNHRWQWLLLAPALLVGVTVGMLYVLMSPAETSNFIETYLYRNQMAGLEGLMWWQGVVHHAAKIVFALQIPPILVLGLRKIRQYNESVEASYADTDDKRLHLMTTILLLFVVTSFMSFGANLLGRYRFADSLWLLIVPSLVFSVLQFMLGYAGYHQKFTVSDLLCDMQITEDTQDTDAEEESIQQDKMADLQQKLTDTVSRNKLYLQPELKITDVANLLHTNRTYVSRVLKEQIGTTFADFINHQRIDYACQLMEQQPQLPAAEVASQSGFSSQSSFYRNFKLYKGCSPKDYQPAQT